jgi:hypothetical protein
MAPNAAAASMSKRSGPRHERTRRRETEIVIAAFCRARPPAVAGTCDRRAASAARQRRDVRAQRHHPRTAGRRPPLVPAGGDRQTAAVAAARSVRRRGCARTLARCPARRSARTQTADHRVAGFHETLADSARPAGHAGAARSPSWLLSCSLAPALPQAPDAAAGDQPSSRRVMPRLRHRRRPRRRSGGRPAHPGAAHGRGGGRCPGCGCA